MSKLENIQIGCLGVLASIFIANFAYTYQVSLFAIPFVFLLASIFYGWQRFKTSEFCVTFDLLTKNKNLTTKIKSRENLDNKSTIDFSWEEIQLLKKSFPKSGLKTRFGSDRDLDFDELDIVDEVDIALAQIDWELNIRPFRANGFLQSLAPSKLSEVSRIPSRAFYSFCRLTYLMKSNLNKALESLMASVIFVFILTPGIRALNLHSWLEITLSTISFLLLWITIYKIHKWIYTRKLNQSHEEELLKYPTSLRAIVIQSKREAVKQFPDNPISQNRHLEKLVRQRIK